MANIPILTVYDDNGNEIPIPAIKGKDGASVTVASVTESTESGGYNHVIFSDGKGMTVRNGKDYELSDADKQAIASIVKGQLKTETWTFTLEDDTTVTKAVYVG